MTVCDNDFEPKLGRISTRDGNLRSSYLREVKQSVARAGGRRRGTVGSPRVFEGSRIGRGAGVGGVLVYWEITQLIGNKFGANWNYTHPLQIMDEIARTTRTFAGVSFERLERDGALQWPVNDKAPMGTPIMHIGTFVRGKGNFLFTEYIPMDEKVGPRFPLLLTTGRMLSQYNVGAQTRPTDNVLWHEEDRLEIHPQDAEDRGIRDGDWVRLRSRSGETSLRAQVTERVAPGVVYTTFDDPSTQANVVTSDFANWATSCPEYEVTAVQVSPSNGPSDWQEKYDAQARQSRRIVEAAPATE